MGNIKHSILNEKYRPDNLESYLCGEENKSKFQEFINSIIDKINYNNLNLINLISHKVSLALSINIKSVIG